MVEEEKLNKDIITDAKSNNSEDHSIPQSSEINDKEKCSDHQSLMNELVPESDEVNLAYRGHKHMYPKGKNAERRDVLYKNFIRATRRYLWEMFEKDFKISSLKSLKNSEEYKSFVIQFYDKHFKMYAGQDSGEDNQFQIDIYFVLSTILNNK